MSPGPHPGQILTHDLLKHFQGKSYLFYFLMWVILKVHKILFSLVHVQGKNGFCPVAEPGLESSVQPTKPSPPKCSWDSKIQIKTLVTQTLMSVTSSPSANILGLYLLGEGITSFAGRRGKVI